MPEYGGIDEFEPQEADWNESDIFPNDEALVLHFVSKYPDYDDLEVTITEDILGEEFEGVKKKAAQNLERKARQLSIAPDMLQEIIDAKDKMNKAAPGSGGGAKAGSKDSGSIFDKNDETRQHFQFLKELLAPDYILSNHFELENFIAKNDAKMRFLILRNFKNREHSQTAMAKLETFARLNGLPAEFFKYNSLYSDYRLQGAKIDEAIHLMFQRHSLEDVS